MKIVLLFAGGFVWGTAVSVLNYIMTKRALERRGGKRAQLIFIFRLLVCAAAMFVVSSNTAVLLGTALGLVSVKNYTLIKVLQDMRIQKRKG